MARGDWPSESAFGPEDGIPKGWRRAGIVAAVIAFLLVSAAIVVSTIDVTYGTRVYGQKTFYAGRRGAVRVAALDLSTLDFAPRLHAAVRLVGPGGEVPLGEGDAGATRAVDVNFVVPAELAPGSYTLEAQVETDAGEPERARFPVEVRPGREAGERPARWLQVRPVCEEGARPRREGGWTASPLCGEDAPLARLYPESGHLVANLENRVFVFAPSADGLLHLQPLRAPPAPGAPRPAPTARRITLAPDPLGLAPFDYLPTYPRGEIAVETSSTRPGVWRGEAGATTERRAEILLRDLPSQILLKTDAGLVQPDTALGAELHLLRSRVPVFLDMWVGGRWIGADSAWIGQGGSLEYGVQLPADTDGFAALRAYVGLGAPGGAYDERVFFLAPSARSGRGVRRLAQAVADLPAAPPLAEEGAPPGADPLPAAILAAPPKAFALLDDAGRGRAAQALLSRVSLTVPPSPLLGDSTSAKRAAVEAFKARLRFPLLTGLFLLGTGVFLGAAWLVVQNRRAVRRRLAELELDEVDDAPSAGEGGAVAPPRRLSAAGLLLPALALLFILAAAGVGLLILLETLSWNVLE